MSNGPWYYYPRAEVVTIRGKTRKFDSRVAAGGYGYPPYPRPHAAAAAGDGSRLAAHRDPGLSACPGVDAPALARARLGHPHRAIGGADRARRGGQRGHGGQPTRSRVHGRTPFAPESITGTGAAAKAA